jgi:putative salt-induced outer membrane protein
MKKFIYLALFSFIFIGSLPVAHAADMWKNELSLGFAQATGNTQNSQLTGAVEADKKTELDVVTLKASTLYSSQHKKMDGQKHDASIRYALNFPENQWYSFYKFSVDHDKFSNIDYRLIPTAGIGYWFSNTDDWKAMTELGLGLENINYSDNTKDKTNTILVPRAFVEKAIFEKAKISQDLTLYPNLEESDDLRVVAETRFTNPLSDNMSLRFSFVDEFNSNPAGESKKNDTRTVLALIYSF